MRDLLANAQGQLPVGNPVHCTPERYPIDLRFDVDCIDLRRSLVLRTPLDAQEINTE